MPGVTKARPYRHFAMDSTGDADGMYLRQYQFPDIYQAHEPLIGEYHDRLPDHVHIIAACKRHMNTGDMGIGQWVMGVTPEQAIAFFKDILQADERFPGVVWTGFRLTGSIYRGRGKAIYYIELFAKKPDSNTKVYTGEDAPNVLGYSSPHRRIRTPRDIMSYGFGTYDS